jgi:hypothetical protein
MQYHLYAGNALSTGTVGAAMYTEDITYDDMIQIVKACAPVRVTPSLCRYLKDFLVARLAKTSPDARAKVGKLDQVRMEQLCKHLQETQRFAE